MKTIATEIDQVEQEIRKCESRLDAIERLCRLTHLSDEKWKSLQEEKTALEKDIVDRRVKLKGLRWENWRSMLVSVILLGFVYLVYIFVFTKSSEETSVQTS